KTGVISIATDDTAMVAAEEMRISNIGFLPVCDQQCRLVGTLTDRDIALRVVAEGRATSTQVENIMTRNVITCSPEDPLEHAEDLMSAHKVSRIVCLEGGEIAGVISLSDIARVASDRDAAETLREITEREAA